jgi:guanylate cyclase
MNTIFRELLTKSFLALSIYASDPVDGSDVRLKKTTAIIAALAATSLYLGYALFYFWFNERWAAIACLGMSVLFALGFASYWKVRQFYWHMNYWLTMQIVGISTVHVILGGFLQSGMVIIWLLVPTFLSLFLIKPVISFYWLLAATFAIAMLWILYPYYLRPENNFPPLALAALSTVNITGFGGYAYLILYYFVWQNEILANLVLNEQAKTESLLLNILPKDIAIILKNENRVIADQFENTSILFADVVNFTPMSASMTPTELVELLNEVYSHFDTIVEKYNLEKIKTIGDCYMVAAGVPRRRIDHAIAITQLALDIRDYVSSHEFGGRQLKFRIGINSGSVVAGVIGRKKFAYDLWGDTVNTASRMESHGSGGFIQVTEDTYNLIKNDFNCESRGKVNVKGKGEISVWYVTDKLS